MVWLDALALSRSAAPGGAMTDPQAYMLIGAVAAISLGMIAAIWRGWLP